MEKRRKRRSRVNRGVEKLKRKLSRRKKGSGEEEEEKEQRKKVRYGLGLDCLFRNRQEEMLKFYITIGTCTGMFLIPIPPHPEGIFSPSVFSYKMS